MAIKLDSKGSIIYRQERVGKGKKKFLLYKFRTMKSGSDKMGLLTIGSADARITKAGKLLRRFKLDEFPQFVNVLKGEMSVVGPRPEVPKYVAHYNEEQTKVFVLKPGITDLASLKYFEESDILAREKSPEEVYLKEVMPAKLKINLDYIEKQSLWLDIKIIFQTLWRMVRA